MLSTCRMIRGHPPPPPQASVCELYIQGVQRQRRGEPFRTGKGVGGPKSYDSTEILVLYILYSLYGENIWKIFVLEKLKKVFHLLFIVWFLSCFLNFPERKSQVSFKLKIIFIIGSSRGNQQEYKHRRKTE